MSAWILAPLLAAQMPLPACRIDVPAACTDTNRLANSSGFDRALRRFLRGQWQLVAGGRQAVAREAAAVLGGPPDEPARVGPLYRFTACRAHECSDKVALVVTAAGTIVAVGILHSTCAMPKHGPACFNENILSIYARDEWPGVPVDLKKWAGQAVAASYRMPGEPPPRLLRTNVVRVDRAVSSAPRPH